MLDSNRMKVCLASHAVSEQQCDRLQSGMTNAERLLEKYHNEWNESVDPIYNDDFTY